MISLKVCSNAATLNDPFSSHPTRILKALVPLDSCSKNHIRCCENESGNSPSRETLVMVVSSLSLALADLFLDQLRNSSIVGASKMLRTGSSTFRYSLYARQHLRHQQRVTAEVEEVPVASDRRQP